MKPHMVSWGPLILCATYHYSNELHNKTVKALRDIQREIAAIQRGRTIALVCEHLYLGWRDGGSIQKLGKSVGNLTNVSSSRWLQTPC